MYSSVFRVGGILGSPNHMPESHHPLCQSKVPSTVTDTQPYFCHPLLIRLVLIFTFHVASCLVILHGYLTFTNALAFQMTF